MPKEQRLEPGQMETGLLPVDSRVTAVRIRLGMSPFSPPNHLLSLFHLTEFIVNLPGVGKHLLLELQPASV